MAPRPVYLRDEGLEVKGVGVIPLSDELGDAFVGSFEVVSSAGLSSLRRALVDHFGQEAQGRVIAGVNPRTGERTTRRLPPTTVEVGAVHVVDAPESKFAVRNTYEFLPEPVSLAIIEGGLLTVRVEFVLEGEDEPDQARWAALLAPILQRARSSIVAVEPNPQGAMDFRTSSVVTDPDFWVTTFYISVPMHGRDVASALAIGRGVLAVLEAAAHGALTPESTRTLIESGRADLLLGQPEGSWLDCKTQLYAENDHGKYELAKDVAAFANADRGGLIVIGLQTRSVGGRDVVTTLRPIHCDSRLPDKYRKWLAHRLFPHPTNLEIRLVNVGSGSCVLLILIPPQPPGLRPFLVRGMLRDGRVLGTHVGIFTRRDDATVEVGVEELHSLLVAGRVALQYDT